MKKPFVYSIITLSAIFCALSGTVNAEEKAETPEAIIDAYVAAWNEADEGARRAFLERAWSDDGVYSDPGAKVEGRDALLKHTGNFQNNPDMKGFSLERVSGVDVHHNVLRFDWALKSPDDKVVMAGVDYGVLADDGRLDSITGFFGPIPDKK